MNQAVLWNHCKVSIVKVTLYLVNPNEWKSLSCPPDTFKPPSFVHRKNKTQNTLQQTVGKITLTQ